MHIDWLSSENIEWINPRFPAQDQEKLKEMLTYAHPLKAHVCLTTSGTSGFPKWVLLSKEAMLVSAASVNKHLEVSSADRWIHALPNFHVGGLAIWARSSLLNNPVSVFSTKWNSEHFCQFAEAEKGTLTALVPTQIFDLVASQLRAPKNLRAIVVGGGRLSEELYLKGRELGWNLLPSYGLTECASQVATASLSSLHEHVFPRLTLLSHISVHTIDGIIALKSPALLTAYILQTNDGIKRLDPKVDGVFQTEDKGKVEEGYLIPDGRGSDFVKIAGECVDLVRLDMILEKVKLTHQCESDAVIVPVPHPRLGHAIHLISSVVPHESLLSQYNAQVMPFERINQAHLVAEIPRTSLGKVKKQALIDLILQ